MLKPSFADPLCSLAPDAAAARVADVEAGPSVGAAVRLHGGPEEHDAIGDVHGARGKNMKQ